MKEAAKEMESITEEEVTLAKALKAELRDVMGESGKTIDMGRKRPMDQKNNHKVRMPGPAPPKIEAEFSTRLSVWQKAFMSYRDKHCDEEGVQSMSNLSPNQMVGLKTLSRKVSKLEAIVLQADKGKQFVVVDQATYLQMAEDHISKDVRTTPSEVAYSQRVLSATAKAVGNILGLGRAHSDAAYARSIDNCGSEAEDVPGLKLLPKTHKDPDPRGHPKSRPVVTSASGMEMSLLTTWTLWLT